MRAFLSIGALVVVAYIVLKLSATQLQALAPTPVVAGGGASPSAAQQAADKVIRAVDAGAAQRAADAASR